MILLFGTVVKNRHLALFGATFVVLINIARLVAGCANLAVVPFRDGVDIDKMKKPLRRVIEPAVTIGLVFAAFTFIPWLSSGIASQGTFADRMRSSADGLKNEMKDEVNRNVDKYGGQAREKFKELEDKTKDLDLNKFGAQADQKLKGLGLPSSGGQRPPP